MSNVLTIIGLAAVLAACALVDTRLGIGLGGVLAIWAAVRLEANKGNNK